jgi:hypothetical protein
MQKRLLFVFLRAETGRLHNGILRLHIQGVEITQSPGK